MMPDLVIFDVDKTLARSKQPIDDAMAEALTELLTHTKVAIISGDSLMVLQNNVIGRLPHNALFEHLMMLTTSGAALYIWKDSGWRLMYEERIDESEIAKIGAVIRTACIKTHLVDFDAPSFGDRIEYRGGQITLSALGQQAPIEKKEEWDPDGTKKRMLRDAIGEHLPEYDVKVGGSTSIDITKAGINKAYGVRKLSEFLNIPIGKMLYVGDALFPGGNDEVVKESGIKTHAVKGPEDTTELIEALLAGRDV